MGNVCPNFVLDKVESNSENEQSNENNIENIQNNLKKIGILPEFSQKPVVEIILKPEDLEKESESEDDNEEFEIEFNTI